MKTIGVREFRSNLSKFLRDVSAQGDVIEVTRNGRTIARLVLVDQAPIQTAETGLRAIWAETWTN